MSLDLARRLVESQRPELAGLPLAPIGEGWDNWSFRIGDEWLARLPRRSLAAPLIENEWNWLPRIASGLPLEVPVPIHLGRPEFGYPFPWAIYPFLPGTPASLASVDDWDRAARSIGRFLAALHQPAPTDAPDNPFRGVPLSERDETTRGRMAALRGEGFEGVDRIARIWEEALGESDHDGDAVWLHGDFHPSNLLVEHDEIVAVVDWGDITRGDPAVDLSVGWMLLPPDVRADLRQEAGASEDTWARARGWALSLGLAMLTNSADNPVMGNVGLRTVRAVLEDR